MNQNNTQLPKEVVDKINSEADLYGFAVPYNGSNSFYIEDKVKGYQAGATEYATRLHTLQVEFNNIRQANKRWEESFNIAQRGYDTAYKDLEELKSKLADKVEYSTNAEAILTEVFQKHESGLLPDRFIYDKIKKFLYGE